MEISVTLVAAGDAVEAVALLPPGVSSASDVVVEVLGNDMLLLQAAGCDQPMQVPLPAPIDPDTGRVRFKRATGKLTFTASIRRADAPPTSSASATCLGAATQPPANGNHKSSSASPRPPELQPSAATGALAPRATVVREPSAAAAAAASAAPAAEPGDSFKAAIAAAPHAHAHPPNSVPVATSEEASPAVGQPPVTAAAGPTALANDRERIVDGSSYSAASPASDGDGTVARSGNTAPSDFSPLKTNTPDAAAAAEGAGGSGSNNLQGTSPPAGTAARMAGGAAGTAAAAAESVEANDAELYREFYCDSPPAMPAPRPAAVENGRDAVHTPPGEKNADGGGAVGGSVNASRVAAAFEPTGGTSSRDAGFSFTAPDLPPPPPLPAGLPPVAPPIDCRYLAVANGMRVSAHASTAALAEALGLRRRPSAAAERRSGDKVKAILQRVADTLDAYGYAVLDNYIAEAAIQGARAELRVMEPHYSPGMIWVGKEAETGAQISVSSVRGDVVLWLDDQALNATAFVKDGVRRGCSFMQLQQMLGDVDELVFEGLRPRLPYLAGLHRRSDAMMAVYPGKGARFAKHVDNTTQDGRRLTVLTYLNPGWQEKQGGALRLFPVRPGAAEVVDVLPVAGRVALFLSAEVAHEVMPAYAPRHAVTLWYFDAGEHAAALTAAKVLPGASSRPSAQAAATALLRDLLADEAASDIKATPDGCEELGSRVAALERGAQQLLAAVLGLPSAAAVVESMQNLTPETLRMRREELRNMGLGTQHHAPDTSTHV